MTKELFFTWLENSATLEKKDEGNLSSILNEYPFFQSAHLLHSKLLHNCSDIRFHETIKKTAIIAGDRKILFRLIRKNKKESIHAEQKLDSISTTEIQTEIKIPNNPENEIVLLPNTVTVEKNSISQKFDNKDLSASSVVGKADSPKKSDRIALINEEEMPSTIEDVIAESSINAFVEKDILRVTEINKKEIQPREELSFTDWIKSFSSPEKSVKNPAGIEVKTDKQKTIEHRKIVEKIIKEEPRITKIRSDKSFFTASTVAKSSVLEDENLVTETLAKIYSLQGNYSKALRAYEILSLKNPEKSVYFAALVTEIKNKLKNQ